MKGIYIPLLYIQILDYFENVAFILDSMYTVVQTLKYHLDKMQTRKSTLLCMVFIQLHYQACLLVNKVPTKDNIDQKQLWE